VHGILETMKLFPRFMRPVSAALICLPVMAALILAPAASSGQAAPSQRDVILATTTSTQDSGLLDALMPLFEKKTGYFVKTIAVGSGQALAMGQKGEADVLLSHSPEGEEKFMAGGFGINRRLVMHNDFVVVGPASDPAGIKGMKSAAAAFRRIAAKQALFMSRDDNSGTDAKEKALWKAAGVAPEGQKWQRQTGLGMGQTLQIASEKQAYTLSDRGTYLALKKNLDLVVLVEGDKGLLNIYHVIEVNQARWPKVNAPGARAFSDFMAAPETQGLIRAFGVDKFGSPLFFPDAGRRTDDLGK
jgi:tungstate transport system substrate-binding protein